MLLLSKSDLIDPFRSWVDWKIKVEAVLVSALVMPGKPRGIVQTIHNMGALYKHLHHVRDKRMVRTIGITYPQRYSHGLFIPLKQGLKCYTSNKYFKQTLIDPHCTVRFGRSFSHFQKCPTLISSFPCTIGTMLRPFI